MERTLTTPLTDEAVAGLRAGDQVLLTGTLLTARDAAHKRLAELLDRGEPLPVELAGQVIYYAGPSPAKPGKPVGSIGPTTSGRMDAYTPRLLDIGLKGMVGKGYRSPAVKEAMVRNRAVYFAAVGGAAALLAQRVKAARVVAYEDLGPEAIRALEVVDFPVIVVNDIYGGDIYEEGRRRFERKVGT
ncbi:MAG: Fe-S-containing hydro-lyase [Thermoleophilia bacterium]|nr:Fe-S-containing hydro-lyase [Actinomycetota bacterium]